MTAIKHNEKATALNNITYTDSESTKLLKKESDELYFQDFKDALATAIFTDDGGTVVTANDTTGDLFQTNCAEITQSSASAGEGTQFIIVENFRCDRTLDWFDTL